MRKFSLMEERKKLGIICLDDADKKKLMMDTLIQLKIKKQHKLGIFSSLNNKGENSEVEKEALGDIMGTTTPPNEAEGVNPEGGDKKSVDGYWTILHDWTECNLACGGGVQTLQMICVDPINGGKPCEGEAIRNKPCNTHPCPESSTMSIVLKQKKQKEALIKPPIVKEVAISNRPLRYDKCHIKESDALYTPLDRVLQSQAFADYPTRVIMNERTVSVFQGEDATTMKRTFLLKSTVFTMDADRKSCFILTDLSAKARICKLESSKSNFVEEWNYDFHLFKNQCFKPTKTSSVDEDKIETKQQKEEYKKKLKLLQAEYVQEKTKKMQVKVAQQEEVEENRSIEKMEEMELMSLEKERIAEDRVIKEQEEKFKEEKQELENEITNEKKKAECLQKSIKQKEMEDQYNINKTKKEKALVEIKEQLKTQILHKRAQMKKKMEQNKLIQEREMERMKSQIQTLKRTTVENFSLLNKHGDAKKCFNPSTSSGNDTMIRSYCLASFSESPSSYSKCIDKDAFCFVCCENEFGEANLIEREQCFDKVCAKEAEVKEELTIVK